MAWTTPRTWAAELVSVSAFNTHIRDNLNFLKDPEGQVSLVSARNFSLDTSGTWSLVDTGDIEGLFRHTLAVTNDSIVNARFAGQILLGNNVAQIGFGVSVNGTQYFPTSGLSVIRGGNVTNISATLFPVNLELLLTAQSAGNNVYRLSWFGTHVATTLLSTGGYVSQFSVKEMP